MELKEVLIITVIFIIGGGILFLILTGYMKDNCVDSCHTQGIEFKTYSMIGSDSGCYCNLSKPYNLTKKANTGLCRIEGEDCEALG